MNPRRLSPRQEQIVELVVAHRMSYTEIAVCLGISVHTVRSHVGEIGRKLGGGSPQKAMAKHYLHPQEAA